MSTRKDGRKEYECDVVFYHSTRWEHMVEQGWITHSVDGRGIAMMIRKPMKHP